MEVAREEIGDEESEEEEEEEEEDGDDVQDGDGQETAEGVDGAHTTPRVTLVEEHNGHADSGSEGSTQRSRAPSPTDSLIAHTSALQLQSPTKATHRSSHESEIGDENEEGAPLGKLSRDAIRERITSDISRHHARQTSKYHSKRSTRRVGRPKGSKAKQDTRVKIDRSGVWE